MRFTRCSFAFAMVLMACASLPLAACGESADAQPAGPAPGTVDADVEDGGPASAVDAPRSDAATDGATAGGPATPVGKIDPLCAFTNYPFRRDDLLLVDPTGKRLAYPRLLPGDAGELVIRDLETNTVTRLGSLGSCTSERWAGSTVLSWSASSPVSWMRSTPYGILFADVDSALHLVDWTGAEKARLPPAAHAWKRGEVMAVGAGADGIRSAMVRRAGAVSRLVTFASNGGAGVSVESAELSPAFAADANVETAVSADGGHAAAIVAFKTLYAAPATAGATANVLYLSNATFRAERTARGALVSDLFSSFDVKPRVRHVDFATALDQNLTHFPSATVATSQVGAAVYLSEIASSSSAVTGLSTWRFDAGKTPTAVATTVPTDGNPPAYGTYVARTTSDASNYVFSLDGVGTRASQQLVYSLSLTPAASAFRPVRVASAWAVGGEATLATVEGSTLRFEKLATTSGAPIEVPMAADLQQHGRLQGLTKDGRIGFFEVSIYDEIAKDFRLGIDSMNDAGVRRTHQTPQLVGALDFQPAWSDGLVAVLVDGFYFFR